MAAGLLGCEGLTSGDGDPVAIEFIDPPDSILVGETLTVQVRALNRSGDSIPGVIPKLLSENPDTLAVTDDSTAIIGRIAGPGRMRAVIGDLQTAIFPIPVRTP